MWQHSQAGASTWRFSWVLVVALVGCQSENNSADNTAEVPAKPEAAGANEPQSSPEGVVSTVATSGGTIADTSLGGNTLHAVAKSVPDWAADAIFYQIFPERFRNGDSANDPTHASLEKPETVPDSWRISSWTGDWYATSDWEQELDKHFYDNGVFQRRYGGDLQGVLEKLDYLESLGINAIYFNPVFYGRSLHKYDGASMHHIDPFFGPDPQGDLEQIAREGADPETWAWTTADKLFLEFVRTAHERDIRVIIDGVFNHTGRDFFAFADLLEKQADSPYQDWYIVQRFDDPETPPNDFRYKGWWGVESLPEFADNPSGDDLHAGPKAYLMDITRRWMDPDGDGDPSDGIDGWRLDVANEVPMGFWRDWHALVRTLNPEAYTVGEFWGNARDQLIEGGFSATMNYHGFAYLVKGYLMDGTLTPHDFANQLQTRMRDYPTRMQFALQNLVDSHDTDRVASMIVNAKDKSYSQPERFDYDVGEHVTPRHSETYDVRRPNDRERRIQRLVALMQMTFVGPPMIYYGTEAGMWGADDPCDRMPMVWVDLKYEDQAADPLGRPRTPDSVQFDQALFDYYRDVVHLRRESNVLRRGSFEPVATDDAALFFAFRRSLDGESVLVAINRGEKPYVWHLPQELSGAPQTVFQASPKEAWVEAIRDGDRWELIVPPLDAVVLAAQPE